MTDLRNCILCLRVGMDTATTGASLLGEVVSDEGKQLLLAEKEDFSSFLLWKNRFIFVTVPPRSGSLLIKNVMQEAHLLCLRSRE